MSNVDNTKDFNCISLCTGYAGIELGLERVIPNLRTVCYVEVEAFACANLVAKIEQGKLAKAPIWTDIKTFDGRPFRNRVHIITGGYPCQPFSVAGKRQGESDPRHLWPYIEGIIEAVRPIWCFFENVSGHLTIGFPDVYRSLRNLDYSVEAGLFTAAEVGAPHKRERLFILAYSEQRRRRWTHGIQEGFNRSLQTQGPSELDKPETTKWRWIPKKYTGRGIEEAGGPDGSELADTTDNGLPEQQSGSIQEGQFNTIQEQSECGWAGSFEGRRELADTCKKGRQECRASKQLPESKTISCTAIARSRDKWPSRPGQPQYEWEEPRVVADTESMRKPQQERSIGYIRRWLINEGQEIELCNEIENRWHIGEVCFSESGLKKFFYEMQEEAQSGVGGAVDGTQNRVDRLKLLGNGVVPQCAELAFRALIEKFK